MKIIRSHSNSPSFNLAAEEYLFFERTDELLFLYVNEPSVIIGSNQVLQNEVNLDFCDENNIQILRRLSGGGAVYHDLGNLNFCFISNKIAGKSSIDADFLLPVISVLHSLNIPVEAGKRKDLWLPGGFKISGTASHISKNRELLHGTLLYDTDLEKLRRSLAPKSFDINLRGIASVSSPVMNIRAFLKVQNQGAPESIDIFNLICQIFMDLYFLNTLTELSRKDIKIIRYLQTNKYELMDWTFKK